MKLVAFTGYKGSGKTTAAATLRLRKSFVQLSFAFSIKEMLSVMGLTDAELYGSAKELPCGLLGGKTPRHAMQTLGYEWGRELISEDIWVWVLRKRIIKERRLRNDIVIDDCRFPNEVEMIHDFGGKVFWIKRAGEGGDSHESESHIPHLNYDGVIENCGDLGVLEKSVFTAIET